MSLSLTNAHEHFLRVTTASAVHIVFKIRCASKDFHTLFLLNALKLNDTENVYINTLHRRNGNTSFHSHWWIYTVCVLVNKAKGVARSYERGGRGQWRYQMRGKEKALSLHSKKRDTTRWWKFSGKIWNGGNFKLLLCDVIVLVLFWYRFK